MSDTSSDHDMNLTTIVVTGLVGILLILGALFASYRYSQSKSSGIVLPGGVTYLGPPSPTQPPSAIQPTIPVPTPVLFTAPDDVAWKIQKGKLYPYTFSFPETLQLLVFEHDPMDSVAFSWNDMAPQRNILLNIELIAKRDPALVKKDKKAYVQDWWNFFSGLKGVSTVTIFTNRAGLHGYKAQYINTLGETPNTDIFFEIPGHPDMMIHLANGLIDPPLFDRIVDSVVWNK